MKAAYRENAATVATAAGFHLVAGVAFFPPELLVAVAAHAAMHSKVASQHIVWLPKHPAGQTDEGSQHRSVMDGTLNDFYIHLT